MTSALSAPYRPAYRGLARIGGWKSRHLGLYGKPDDSPRAKACFSRFSLAPPSRRHTYVRARKVTLASERPLLPDRMASLFAKAPRYDGGTALGVVRGNPGRVVGTLPWCFAGGF
jgi:hypothetical protein